MSLNLGGSRIDKVFLGSHKVDKIYLGVDKIYPSNAEDRSVKGSKKVVSVKTKDA